MISASLDGAVSSKVASTANVSNNIVIVAEELAYLFESLRKLYVRDI